MEKIIRKDILEMIHSAKSGHPGGALSAVEIMSALYFSDVFRYDVNDSAMETRDRFILSKGHAAPVLYAVLGNAGFFDKKHFKTLRKFGSILQGHPHAKHLNGCDMSSGSLGQGLSIAVGKALALRMKNIDANVYCLVGDGELQEGQIWEATMSAAQLKLDNLCLIVDYNGIQLDGNVADIKDVYPLKEKLESFNFNVIEVDGHNKEELINAYKMFKSNVGKPTAIIAKTVKGKGVSFMENNANWHGLAPNDEELKLALKEIEGGLND